MTSIAIIGTGFGGLAAAIELTQHGFDDVVLFERGEDVGGTWRENTYPGAACDVPSPFYSYSFEPNPHWPHRFSRQPAILDYIRRVADKYDLRRRIRFGTEVTAATFDEATSRWHVELSRGEPVDVDVLVSAVGQLSRPSVPAIPGRDSFAGITFHSAQWAHDVDLTGKRVAVIGTGASAIQFIPAIQPAVAHLDVYQRTAPYLLPRPDRVFGPRHHAVFAKVPATLLAERATWYGVVEGLSVAWVYSKGLSKAVRAYSRWHMKRQTANRPGLFAKVWPDYPVGCKRILFTSDYLPAIESPNVDLLTGGVREITRTGVVGADGVERPVDVIIWGTGFKATEFLSPMRITGVGGRDLHLEWSEGARAYYGISVPHFPNLAIMYGPNTNTGGGSIIYFLETQARYIREMVQRLEETRVPLEVRQDVAAAHDEQIQRELAGSVWSQCTSWYRNAEGRITTNWPKLGAQYRRHARFRAEDYQPVA